MHIPEDLAKLRREAPIKAVLLFAVFVVLFVAAVYVFTWTYISFYPASPETLPVSGSGAIPGPQLQTDEPQDFRNFRTEQLHVLSTGDTAAKRIPIDDAMRLTVERGLPTR